MYAAAGGASLARKRQLNNKKATQQIAKEKQAAVKASNASTPTKSKQFHQLPASYLKAPHSSARKLSAGYAAHSKLLLPISEQAQFSHQFAHNTPKSPTHTFHRDERLSRRQYLTKSATASLPLVSQSRGCAEGSQPDTPTLCFNEFQRTHEHHAHQQFPASHLHAPDPIIITPATPLASPGNHAAVASAAAGQLERKCSVYRGKRLEPHEENFYKTTTITTAQEHFRDEYLTYYSGLPNGVSKWELNEFCESENRHIGVCTCDHIECAQGRAAWLERGRRCSVQDNQASCGRRWVKRNRIQDASLGGSSDDEDFLSVIRGPSSFANAFLYVGLGTIAIGLVIAFVGTGEKGFKTIELRLIGPSLIAIGLVCCILRILFCICPSHCITSRRNREKKKAKNDADPKTSLLRGENNKRVQIARGPSSQTMHKSQSQQTTKSIVKHKNYEGVEALRQIATTSLFLENEQEKRTINRIVPIIKEPEKIEEPSIELKKVDVLQMDTLNIIDMTTSASDDDDLDILNNQRHTTISINAPDLIINNYNHTKTTGNSDEECPPTKPDDPVTGGHHLEDMELGVMQPQEQQLETKQTATVTRQGSKLSRQRTSLNQQQTLQQTALADTLLMETSLTIIEPISPLHFQSATEATAVSTNFSTFATNTTITTLAMSSPPQSPKPEPMPPPPPLQLSQLNAATLPPTTSLPLASATASTTTTTGASSSSIGLANNLNTISNNFNNSTATTTTTSSSLLLPPTESELVLSPSKLGQ